jgi:hypothetical protein
VKNAQLVFTRRHAVELAELSEKYGEVAKDVAQSSRSSKRILAPMPTVICPAAVTIFSNKSNIGVTSLIGFRFI